MRDLIRTKDLKKNYYAGNEELCILKGINFTIRPGESAVITGESGSGKSTFLNLIGGLDSATSGSIKIDGTEITDIDEEELTVFRNQKIGFIFQSHFLLEEFTSIENVMLPYLINDFNKARAKQKAEEILVRMGMGGRLFQFPSRLSGGEKQRVAIARAFINDPALILADEPTGNLDEKNAQNVIDLLFEITKEKKRALVLVTHSKLIAKKASKHYMLERGLLKTGHKPGSLKA